nr:PlmB [Aspergillus flavipes]
MSTTASIETFLRTQFDYLIVGGGTAGLVLAARLSEDEQVQVGVIEAGSCKFDDPTIDTTDGFAAAFQHPDYDWMLQSTPQTGCQGRIFHVPRGKVLGGSSAINFMLYCRPAAEDINQWGRMGNDGWSWDELAPYYQKSNPIGGDESQTKLPGSTTDCPVSLSLPQTRHVFEERLTDAFTQITQLPAASHPWDGDIMGSYQLLSALTSNGTGDGQPRRAYAASGYLRPSLHRTNLCVLTEAVACKVLLDRKSSSPIACGIQLWHQGTHYEVTARQEIIISAGSVKSPQLLELSGIGDPAVLSSAGIDCIHPMPGVGEQLHDHPYTTVTYAVPPSQRTTDSMCQDPSGHERSDSSDADSPFRGPWSLCGFVGPDQLAAGSWIHPETHGQSTKRRSQNTPVIQLLGMGAYVQPGAAGTDYCPANVDRPACYTFMVSATHPRSRGSCHVRTADPLAAPALDIGLLSYVEDAELLAAGIEFANRVFQSAGLTSPSRLNPPPEMDVDDAAQVRTYVQAATSSFHHLAGTCSMGRVVDERFRVRGISRLRVVDASVMPSPISGNIMATVYGIAERAVEFILEDRRMGMCRGNYYSWVG